MKIVYISGSYPPCKDGVGDFAEHVSLLLPEIGYQDITLVVPASSATPDSMTSIDCDFSFNELYKLVKKISEINPDTILIEYPCNGYGRSPMINILPLLLKLRGIKSDLITTIHEYANYTWKGKVRIALLALAADKVMVTDKWNAELLKRIKNNIKVVLPVPPQIPVFKKENYHTKIEKQLVFSYWGFIRFNKGLHLLFPAFRKFLDQGNKAELRILAELGDSEYDTQLKAQIADLKLEENIVITGFLNKEDISRELSVSDCCILPFTDGVSDRRGTLKAALAMGIPVISTITRSVNLPDGLLNGVNILLSEPDIDGILGNLNKSLDYSIRENIGKKGLIWSENFSWEFIKESLKKVMVENESILY